MCLKVLSMKWRSTGRINYFNRFILLYLLYSNILRLLPAIAYEHAVRPYYAAYLCRKWNASHRGAEKLEEITIIFLVGGGPLNSPTEQYPWNKFDCARADVLA